MDRDLSHLRADVGRLAVTGHPCYLRGHLHVDLLWVIYRVTVGGSFEVIRGVGSFEVIRVLCGQGV